MTCARPRAGRPAGERPNLGRGVDCRRIPEPLLARRLRFSRASGRVGAGGTDEALTAGKIDGRAASPAVVDQAQIESLAIGASVGRAVARGASGRGAAAAAARSWPRRARASALAATPVAEARRGARRRTAGRAGVELLLASEAARSRLRQAPVRAVGVAGGTGARARVVRATIGRDAGQPRTRAERAVPARLGDGAAGWAEGKRTGGAAACSARGEIQGSARSACGCEEQRRQQHRSHDCPHEPHARARIPAYGHRVCANPSCQRHRTRDGAAAGETIRCYAKAHPRSRATWNPAKLCATGMSSMVLTFTCAGCDVAQTTASAMSCAVSGCIPA